MFEILCRQLAQHCENVEDLNADLRSAANMQQIVTKLPLKIGVRRSTRKIGLRPKEFDITNLDEWLKTENQDQEMAFGYGSTKANPDQKKTKSNSIRLVLGNNKKMRLLRLMQIQELKWNVLCAKKSNVN